MRWARRLDAAALPLVVLAACLGDPGEPQTGCAQSCGGGPPPTPSCQTPAATPVPPGDDVWIQSSTESETDTWPNVPPGFQTVSNEGFDALTEHGWITEQRDTTNGSGATLARDSAAPVSPPSVLQYTFGIGFQGGLTPGVTYYDLAVPVKATYFGFWWKPSNPWQNHVASGVNKLGFLLTRATATDGGIVILVFSTGGPYTVQVITEFPPSGDIRRLAPNLAATPVQLGVWHRVEWYVKYSSTPTTPDGTTQWWLDGVLQGSYRDLKMPGDSGFSEYQLAPTWGGTGETKIERDFFCYDHAFISSPPSSGGASPRR